MKKTFFFFLLAFSFSAKSQIVTQRTNQSDSSTEFYVRNSPTNNIGNSKVVMKMKDSSKISFDFYDYYFKNIGAGVGTKVIRYNPITGKFTYSDTATGGGGGVSIGDNVGSGTVGSILYLGTSGRLRQSNSTLFYDSTNIRVGIGTSSPAANTRLHVLGGAIEVGTPGGAYGVVATGLQVDGTGSVVVQFTGANQYNPSFVYNGTSGNTALYTFNSQNMNTTTSGNTVFTGGLVQQNGGSYFSGYQQPFTMQHYYSSVGGATMVLDQTNGGGPTPTASTYKIIQGKFHTTEVFNINGDGLATFNGGVSSPKYSTTTSVFWSSGTGTPEAVVTANIGSLFTRTDGGAGTTLYVKESGTGNTGSVAK